MTNEGTAEDARPTELDRLVGWLDERTGFAGLARTVLRKVFPDHWSFLLGEIALFCYVILVLTGVFLTFFFAADTRTVTYDGPYTPLQGAQVSAAFDSVMRLSFEVRAGLLMRQIHHWTAVIFVAAIVVHVCRIFFTGAFRRPREINWLVGVGLLLMALAAGLTGYSLPDDLLSGTGLRITDSVAVAIPFIGPWFAYLLFGGEFPSAELIGRFYVFHIMLLPALMIGAITLHLLILWFQKHTQFPGGEDGRVARETNVVGRHFWPGQVFRSFGLFLLIGAVLAVVGGLFQINPVWVYGPYAPYQVSSPAQPDWYLGWLEGLLRMGPNWEPTILGVTIPSLVPARDRGPDDRLRCLHPLAVHRGSRHPRPRRAPPPPAALGRAGPPRDRGRGAGLLRGVDAGRRERRPRRAAPRRRRGPDGRVPGARRRRPDRDRPRGVATRCGAPAPR